MASGGDNDVHTGQFIYVYLLNLAQVLNILRYLLACGSGSSRYGSRTSLHDKDETNSRSSGRAENVSRLK